MGDLPSNEFDLFRIFVLLECDIAYSFTSEFANSILILMKSSALLRFRSKTPTFNDLK